MLQKYESGSELARRLGTGKVLDQCAFVFAQQVADPFTVALSDELEIVLYTDTIIGRITG